MRYAASLGTLAASLVFLVPAVVAESRTPIVAKHRWTDARIQPDGTESIVHEVRGRYFRSSSGQDLITQQRVVDGEVQPASLGFYRDLPQGRSYQILYGARKAFLKKRFMPKPEPRASVDLTDKLGPKVVNGILCFGVPVQSNGDAVSGTAWQSVQYDFIVKIDTQIEAANGQRSRVVVEKYDIQTGVEPDPDEVRIPADFRILDDITQLPKLDLCESSTCGDRNIQ